MSDGEVFACRVRRTGMWIEHDVASVVTAEGCVMEEIDLGVVVTVGLRLVFQSDSDSSPSVTVEEVVDFLVKNGWTEREREVSAVYGDNLVSVEMKFSRRFPSDFPCLEEVLDRTFGCFGA